MGEYADMMLDGTCCSSCGEFLGGNQGYPVQCRSCGADEAGSAHVPNRPMGKSTKRLLLEMAGSKTQTQASENSGQMHALVSRGYAKRCTRWGYYELTEAGKARAAQLSKASAVHTAKRIAEQSAQQNGERK